MHNESAYKSIFAGILLCADCKSKLCFVSGDSIKTELFHFICGKYRKKGKDNCSIHSIYEKVLYEIVLEEIRRVTECARERTEEFAEYINKNSETQMKKELKDKQKLLDKHRKRLTEVSTIFRKLYEDNALGRITDEQFQMLSQRYVEEKKQLESDISELEIVVAEMKSKSGSSKIFIELAKRFTDIQELTPEILHTFISKIEIHEKVKDETTGKKSQDIDIYFTQSVKCPKQKVIRRAEKLSVLHNFLPIPMDDGLWSSANNHVYRQKKQLHKGAASEISLFS